MSSPTYGNSNSLTLILPVPCEPGSILLLLYAYANHFTLQNLAEAPWRVLLLRALLITCFPEELLQYIHSLGCGIWYSELLFFVLILFQNLNCAPHIFGFFSLTFCDPDTFWLLVKQRAVDSRIKEGVGRNVKQIFIEWSLHYSLKIRIASKLAKIST